MTIIHRIHQTFVGNNLNDHRPYADPTGQPKPPPIGPKLNLRRKQPRDIDDETAALLERDKRARGRRVYLYGIAAAVIVTFCIVCLLAYQAGEAARQAEAVEAGR